MRCSFYEVVIGLRPLVQELEDELYPYEALPRVDNRLYRWLIILIACQRNPRVAQMVNTLAVLDYPRNDTREFAEQIQRFFPDDSSALQSVGFPTECFNHTALEDVLGVEGARRGLTRLERVTISVLVRTRYPGENTTLPVADDSTAGMIPLKAFRGYYGCHFARLLLLSRSRVV